ncbi:unnamed protein product [Pedinophyceae sp. YPF-701]|nr:unnamed protein product [Pedinophyceae sp. YPF-701]
MPPKADPKAGAAAAGEEDGPDDGERELMERELAISYLKNKLSRYQQTREALAGENSALVAKLEQEKATHTDIINLLSTEVNTRNAKLEQVEKQAEELAEALEAARKEHKEALAAVNKVKDAEIANLKELLEDRDEKLKGLDEFMQQKKRMEDELEAHKEQLAKERREFHELMSDVERQHVQEKDFWQKEMQQQVKETKSQMMKLMDNQLEITTKRTIIENEQMQSELTYQSRQSERIMNKNSNLLSEVGELRRQVELSQQAEVELAKRNNVYQKTIRSLLAKLKARQQGDAAGSHEEVEALQAVVEQQEERIRAFELACRELREQLHDALADVRVREMREGALRDRHDAATRLVQRMVEEIRHAQAGEAADAEDAEAPPATEVVAGLTRDEVLKHVTALVERLRAEGALAAKPASRGAVPTGESSPRRRGYSSMMSGHEQLPPITQRGPLSPRDVEALQESQALMATLRGPPSRKASLTKSTARQAKAYQQVAGVDELLASLLRGPQLPATLRGQDLSRTAPPAVLAANKTGTRK